MATINTTVNNGGVSSGASFSVDTDQIPGLLAKYEDAQDRLREILSKARNLQKIAPPGDDEVSKKMAYNLGVLAGDAPGGVSTAVNDAINRLAGQIDQLRAAQRDYQAADEAATPTQA